MTNIAKTGEQTGASTLWIILLTAASTVTTLALACATPFPALAALAALHMRRRDGLILMALAWGASQATGFFILHYEIRDTTLGWALGLFVAAVASGLGAYAALSRLEGRSSVLRLAAAYAAAFVAFKLVIAAFAAFWLGGLDTSLDLGIMAKQFVRNAAILGGLLAIYHGLIALGAPSARRDVVSA